MEIVILALQKGYIRVNQFIIFIPGRSNVLHQLTYRDKSVDSGGHRA